MRKIGKEYVVPVLIIVVGIGWLLNVLAIIPQVEWIWSLGLAAVGVLTIAVGGFDRLTIVIGPFLIISGIFSVLRQTNNLSVEKELPILTVSLGVLLFLAHALKLPSSSLIATNEDEEDSP